MDYNNLFTCDKSECKEIYVFTGLFPIKIVPIIKKENNIKIGKNKKNK
jgi:hypothetical protein